MFTPINWLREGQIAKTIILLSVISILAVAALFSEGPARAQDVSVYDTIPAVRATAYKATSSDGQLIFSVRAGTSTADLSFNLTTELSRADISESFAYGEDLTPASDLYTLTIATTTQDIMADFKPQLTFKYPKDNRLRNVYIWDKLSNNFIKIASQKDLKKQLASFAIEDYGTITFALFEEKAAEGRASWYVHPRYKKELMAASTQFSSGAKVKVTNLANNKSVIVTIKDYGPDPIRHPDRVVDLNKVAFQKIASTRAGIINVRVEAVIEATSTVMIKK